jgi:lysylphosphatidylglycerol synthetase-like protein (DUF2156 family)
MFQLERLHGFSRKFQPEWRPRYVCVESWPQLPGALFACLRAESLLGPLRWWDRAAW